MVVRGICSDIHVLNSLYLVVAMNKKLILLGAALGGIIGAYIPMLFGDNDLFSVWSILGSVVGGIVGIWGNVWLSRRYDL